ncbi:MAG: Tol-Pal system beta propeller repeat protein TolB [Rhodospirillaceae bacterium]
MATVSKPTRGGVAALAALAALLVVAFAPPARADLHIDITRGVVEPIPIAVTAFAGSGGAETQMGQNIAKVVSADLERSGLFRPIDPSAFIQNPGALQAQPRFADWRLLHTQGLVTGSVTREGDGRLRVEFRLWDVVVEQQLTGLAFFASPDTWRRIAHKIADAVYKRITGEEGYFDTRIVYIAETGPGTARIKRLAIMDQDGENHHVLTSDNTLVLTPRFSPTSQEITYLSYYGGKPRVFLFNIETGRQEVVGDFPGMTFAPRFSPDGNTVIMSLSTGSASNIHTLDLRTRRQTQLTTGPSIDTSPSYSPDGRRIVFESDRGGTQQIYVMNADGSGVQRISFGQGRYGGPVWSPRGDLIAFTRLAGGQFGIGVIRPDGTGERILIESHHAEGPTWAPNGRVLMYFKETASGDGRGRVARLYSVNLGGGNERRVSTPVDGSDPAWSPLIP